jgi:hypothetical protein
MSGTLMLSSDSTYLEGVIDTARLTNGSQFADMTAVNTQTVWWRVGRSITANVIVGWTNRVMSSGVVSIVDALPYPRRPAQSGLIKSAHVASCAVASDDAITLDPQQYVGAWLSPGTSTILLVYSDSSDPTVGVNGLPFSVFHATENGSLAFTLSYLM